VGITVGLIVGIRLGDAVTLGIAVGKIEGRREELLVGAAEGVPLGS